LASRDHIRRALPLLEEVMERAGAARNDIDAIAYTQGPGLAGALLVGASVANSLAMAWDKPTIGIHHLEGHLLSPLLVDEPPPFPFVALLVSGGHTQLMRVTDVGVYETLGETLDDAAGEAFDKTAKLLGLGYPGGPEVSRMAEFGTPGAVVLPRPMLHSGDLDFSFSGLKTAVLTHAKKLGGANICEQAKADLARGFVDAAVEVLAAKSLAALKKTKLNRLVVAGGVGANRQLREALSAAAKKRNFFVHYPDLSLCTDNGAMIALAGAATHDIFEAVEGTAADEQDVGRVDLDQLLLRAIARAVGRDRRGPRTVSDADRQVDPPARPSGRAARRRRRPLRRPHLGRGSGGRHHRADRRLAAGI